MFFHVTVLLAALVMVARLSLDTISRVSLTEDASYMHIQLIVCILLLADIAVEVYFSENRRKNLPAYILFTLIAIPWLNIFQAANLHIDAHAGYILRIIPIIRTTYIIAVITAYATSNRVGGILIGYLAFMFMVAYMGSMLFYVDEYGANPDIHSYTDALWWAIMTMTTAGCSIGEYTITGQVLEIVLSGCGIVFFPIFTVYITDALGGNTKKQKPTAVSSVQNA